jgi:hypothetical protein
MGVRTRIVAGTAGLLSLAGAAIAFAAPNYSIVLSKTGGGIVATCEGCAWQQVSAEYPGGMYRITDRGIAPVSDTQEPAARRTLESQFSFVVTTTERGIAAACDDGCAWTTLTAANSTGSFRITEAGVQTGVSRD